MLAWLVAAARVQRRLSPGAARPQSGLSDRGQLRVSGRGAGRAAAGRHRARRPRSATLARPADSALRTSLTATLGSARGRPIMKLQMIGCSHHHSSVAVRERLAFSPAQVGRGAGRLARSAFREIEAVLLSTCNRVEIYTAAEDRRGRAQPRGGRPVHGRLPRSADLRDLRRPVRADRRRRRAAPVHRGGQSRQHGRRRAADPGPGQAGLRTGQGPPEHRPADARHLSGGRARGQARGHRNDAAPAARQHSQRGGRRFRQRRSSSASTTSRSW